MRRIIKYATRSEGEPRTICVKCSHCLRLRNPRIRQNHLCYGPWPKAIDPVTGKLEPFYEDCREKNGGDCQHFLSRVGWLHSMWIAFVKTFSLVNP
jgi:hypothetical protein